MTQELIEQQIAEWREEQGGAFPPGTPRGRSPSFLSVAGESRRSGEESVREIFVQSYRLLYETHSDAINVLRFVHGARSRGLVGTPEEEAIGWC